MKNLKFLTIFLVTAATSISSIAKSDCRSSFMAGYNIGGEAKSLIREFKNREAETQSDFLWSQDQGLLCQSANELRDKAYHASLKSMESRRNYKEAIRICDDKNSESAIRNAGIAEDENWEMFESVRGLDKYLSTKCKDTKNLSTELLDILNKLNYGN